MSIRPPILVVLALSATPCVPEASPGPAPAAACELPASDGVPARWEDAVVRWPSLSMGGGRGYVVGVDLGVFDDEPIRQPPLQVLSLDGGRVDPPPGDFWFLYPVGATDREGRLHLVWGEPDTPPRPITRLRWPGTAVARSLWHSRLEPGVGWTPPERIHEGPRLDWSPPVRAMVADREGHVHLLAPHVFGALVHLAWDEDGWRSEVASPNVSPVVADLVVGAGHRIAVASAGALFEGPGLGWATANVGLSTEEGGSPWSAPHVVDGRESDDQRLLAVGDSLHLLTGRGELFGLGSIEHRVSGDGGRTWTPRAPVQIGAPSGSWASFDAAADGCGRLHVFYWVARFDDPDAPDVPRLWHTMARDGGWTTPARVSPDEPVVSYDVVSTPAGTLRLFLSRFPAGGGPGDPIHSSVVAWPLPAEAAGEGR